MGSNPGEEEVDKEVVGEFRRVPTGNISDALKRFGIRGTMVGLCPVFEGAKIAGPAFTLRQISAIEPSVTRRHTQVVDELAGAGDVIVIDAGGRMDVATFGEILATRAKIRGVEGVVIDGVTRDIAEIREMRFPVFTRGAHPAGTRNKVETVSLDLEIECGGVRVRPGDLIVGDDTGVVVVPKERAEEVLRIAKEIAESERRVLEALRRGKSLKEASGR
ncbi:MAG: RraA family protein [Candidatus Bathyarchaeia archaeon]